jgi:hypothetical protein
MTAVQTWTPDGCLLDIPPRAAREAANDNTHSILATLDLQRDGLPLSYGITGLSRPAPSIASLPRVIALSGAAGSGKSTISDFLSVHFGYGRSKFAGPLKDMCRALGMTDAMIEGSLKEAPVDWLGGKTPRHAMQTLGTEWGRKCMGDDFWVDMWERRVTGHVIVDDCRFANEAARVRRMGGRVIRLVGRGGLSGGHESERFDFIADAVVENTGTILDLKTKVLRVIEEWRV